MENSAKKRERSANWDEEEKQLLTLLINERIDFIGNKETTTNANNMKKAAWKEVWSHFNTLNKSKRDLRQLMIQWRNLKGKSKSNESGCRHNNSTTDMDSLSLSPSSSEERPVIQTLPNKFLIDSNMFGSDAQNIIIIKQPQRHTADCETSEPPERDQSDESQDPIEIQEDLKPPNITKDSSRAPASNTNLKKKREADYEYQLYLLAKKSKERDNQRAEEIHKQKMTILNLEVEYWKKKINMLSYNV